MVSEIYCVNFTIVIWAAIVFMTIMTVVTVLIVKAIRAIIKIVFIVTIAIVLVDKTIITKCPGY